MVVYGIPPFDCLKEQENINIEGCYSHLRGYNTILTLQLFKDTTHPQGKHIF